MNVMPFFVASGAIGGNKPISVDRAVEIFDAVRDGKQVEPFKVLKAFRVLAETDYLDATLSLALQGPAVENLGKLGALQDIIIDVASSERSKNEGIIRDLFSAGEINRSLDSSKAWYTSPVGATRVMLNEGIYFDVIDKLSKIDTRSSTKVILGSLYKGQLKSMSPEEVAKTVGVLATNQTAQSEKVLQQLFSNAKGSSRARRGVNRRISVGVEAELRRSISRFSDDQLVAIAEELSTIDTPNSRRALYDVFSNGLHPRGLGEIVSTSYNDREFGMKGFYLGKDADSRRLLAVAVKDRLFGGPDPIKSVKQSQVATAEIRPPGYLERFNKVTDSFSR